jgi:hypothetical protein
MKIPQLTVISLPKKDEGSEPESVSVGGRTKAEILKHKRQVRELIKMYRDKEEIAPWRNRKLSYQTLSDYTEYGILEEYEEGGYRYLLTEKFKNFLRGRGINPDPPNQDIVDFLKFEPVYLDVINKITELESQSQDFRAKISNLQNSIYWNFRKIEKLRSKLSCVNKRAARERYRKIPITRNIPDIDDICENLQSPK